jgi:hypothetical protein
MVRVEDQKGDANLQDVVISRGDLDLFIDILRRVGEQAKNSRALDLDTRILLTRLQRIRYDLEPITRRATPCPLETTIVHLPEDWPDKPRG